MGKYFILDYAKAGPSCTIWATINIIGNCAGNQWYIKKNLHTRMLNFQLPAITIKEKWNWLGAFVCSASAHMVRLLYTIYVLSIVAWFHIALCWILPLVTFKIKVFDGDILHILSMSNFHSFFFFFLLVAFGLLFLSRHRLKFMLLY